MASASTRGIRTKNGSVTRGRWWSTVGCSSPARPGSTPETKQYPADVEAQCENCFRNIERALKEAGASLADLVRVQIFMAREEDFAKIAPIIRKHCYAARPTNTAIFARMVSPQMLVEIEATARVPK